MEATEHTGQYLMGRTVGKGSFGKVKIGCHLRTGEKVAIKIIEKTRVAEHKSMLRLRREIAIMRILQHPNLIRLIDVQETTDKIYIITEYVAGGELYDYIQYHRRIPEQRARKIFRDIVDTVSFVHGMGITHRDLKPENILMDRRRGIKIIDFGLSNVIQSEEMLSSRCGSPYYVAPEIAQGKKYTESADIWSIGIILFTMLTGDTPFADENVGRLLGKIIQGKFQMPTYLSTDAQDLLSRILQTDPSTRITLEQLRSHPWMLPSQYSSFYDHVTPTIRPLDADVVDLMHTLGWSHQHITDAVLSDPYSGVARMYRMLHFRKRTRDCPTTGLTNDPTLHDPANAQRRCSVEKPPTSSLAKTINASRAKAETDTSPTSLSPLLRPLSSRSTHDRSPASSISPSSRPSSRSIHDRSAELHPLERHSLPHPTRLQPIRVPSLKLDADETSPTSTATPAALATTATTTDDEDDQTDFRLEVVIHDHCVQRPIPVRGLVNRPPNGLSALSKAGL